MIDRQVTRKSLIPQIDSTGSVLEIGHLRSNRGRYYPRTRSHYCCFNWVVSGNLSVEGDGWKRDAGEGQLLIIAPGEVYEMRVGSDEAETYYIMLDGSGVDQLLRECGLWASVFDTGCSFINQLSVLMDHLHVEEKRKGVDAQASALLKDFANDAKQASGHPLAFEMCSYIHSHWYSSDLNVAALLEEFGATLI